MNKKKILFIIEGLGIGGAEKSLLTLLELFDYNSYEVDLLLFDHSRELMKFIPKKVNLLQEDKNFKTFYQCIKKSPFKFLKKGQLKFAILSFCYLIKCAVYKIMYNKLYVGWDIQKYFFSSIDKEYDTSIAYLERKCIYFNIDKVIAKNKIGFIHNDYSVYQYDYKYDQMHFRYYNHIATVSEHCKEVLIDIFPEYKEKFLVIKNMISKTLIEEMANEEIELVRQNDELIIVTVGRVIEQKGYHIAVDICNELVKLGCNVKWYVIGKENPSEKYKEKLIQKIEEYELQEVFIFLEAQLNPYKYMKFCDVYVQPSVFEGYGITVAEAKALGKIIVASDIPEFLEQLEDYGKGIICGKVCDYIEVLEKFWKEEVDIDMKCIFTDTCREQHKLYHIL
ncbi:MAG: glycosyltransferase [Eubacteriales bacterium]